jgi:predicted transcriptional regulator
MSYTATLIKRLPAPSVKKLLRDRGYTLTDVAKRMDRSHALVSRVVRKEAQSEPVWREIAQMLNGRT